MPAGVNVQRIVHLTLTEICCRGVSLTEGGHPEVHKGAQQSRAAEAASMSGVLLVVSDGLSEGGHHVVIVLLLGICIGIALPGSGTPANTLISLITGQLAIMDTRRRNPLGACYRHRGHKTQTTERNHRNHPAKWRAKPRLGKSPRLRAQATETKHDKLPKRCFRSVPFGIASLSSS